MLEGVSDPTKHSANYEGIITAYLVPVGRKRYRFMRKIKLPNVCDFKNRQIRGVD